MESWRSGLALQAVYGSVLGWQLAPQLRFILTGSPPHLAYMQNLIALRMAALDFLVHGRVMRPPQNVSIIALEPGGFTTAHWCQETLSHDQENEPCCELDIVLTNVYMALNGSFALVLVNHGEHKVAYRASVRLDHAEGSASEVAVDVVMPAMRAQVLLLVPHAEDAELASVEMK